MQYSVYIVSPPNYPHSQCFNEVALSLNAALVELGHKSSVVTTPSECKGKTIVLGGHLLRYLPKIQWPKDMIIYNLEQAGGGWMDKEYIELLKSSVEVWDYSQENIDVLTAYGIDARLCRIGYMPCLTCIENVADPHVDVLHIGGMNPRRQKVLQRLRDEGVKVKCVFNEYGLARDSWIAKSKIILNCHFYREKVFEIVRCSYLVSNYKCVVSEYGLDNDLERGYYEGISFADYGGIVSLCMDLLGDSVRRESIAQRGFEEFSKRSQTEYLRELV